MGDSSPSPRDEVSPLSQAPRGSRPTTPQRPSASVKACASRSPPTGAGPYRDGGAGLERTAAGPARDPSRAAEGGRRREGEDAAAAAASPPRPRPSAEHDAAAARHSPAPSPPKPASRALPGPRAGRAAPTRVTRRRAPVPLAARRRKRLGARQPAALVSPARWGLGRRPASRFGPLLPSDAARRAGRGPAGPPGRADRRRSRRCSALASEPDLPPAVSRSWPEPLGGPPPATPGPAR